MHRHLSLLLCVLLPGCTAFSSVRSAEVSPGVDFDLGVTLASPPGHEAAWFWTWDCASLCDRTIPAVDVGFTRGVVPDDAGSRPYELTFGLSGLYPYAQGYLQLSDGPTPYGAGARLAGALTGWHEIAVFMRRDIDWHGGRILLVPTLFRHAGNSPNGANPGSFTAFAQGIGLELGSGAVSITPSALFVLGRVDRSSYGRRTRAFTSFLVMGASLGLGGR